MSEADETTIKPTESAANCEQAGDQSASSLTCKVCKNTLYEPTDIKCCGITCCQQCVQSCVSQSKPCPGCQKPFTMRNCVPNPILSKILAQLKPSMILKRKIAEHNAYPHLQTKKSILDLKNEIVNTIVEDEIIPFFVRYSSAYSPMEKAHLCDPRVPEPQDPKTKEISFVRGYRCDCRMPISALRSLMAAKFEIDEKFAEIVFYSKGQKLDEKCTLRTVAYRRNEPYSKKMYLDMKILPKIAKKKRVLIVKKIVEGPPVLEDERMPSLVVEEPVDSIEKAEMNELSELDEACLADSRLTYARNVAVATIHKFNEAKMRGKKQACPQIPLIRGLAQIPKMSDEVMRQFFETFRGHLYEKWARALIRPLPAWLPPIEEEPGTSTRGKYDHLLPPDTKNTPPGPARQQQQQQHNAATFNQAVTFNQAATNQALEYYVLRAYKYKIPPERFLEEYYACAIKPPLGAVLTNEQKQAYAYRERFDSTGVIIPKVDAPVQAQLYKQMLDKKELLAKAQLEQEEQLKQQEHEKRMQLHEQFRKTRERLIVKQYLQQQQMKHEQQKQQLKQWKEQQQQQLAQVPKKPKQPRKRKSTVGTAEGTNEEPIVKKIAVVEKPKRSEVTAYVSSRPLIMSAQQCAKEPETRPKSESLSPPPLLIAEEDERREDPEEEEESIDPSVTSSVSPSRIADDKTAHQQSPIGEVSSTSEEKPSESIEETKPDIGKAIEKEVEQKSNEKTPPKSDEKAPPTTIAPTTPMVKSEELDLLTLSRQSSKTLGKTLAESMRKGGRPSNIMSHIAIISPPSDKIVTSSTPLEKA